MRAAERAKKLKGILTPPSRKLQQLLPLKIGQILQVRNVTWADFKGEPDDHLPWSAHAFWRVDYRFQKNQEKQPTISVQLLKSSWVKSNRRSSHLLNHEQGHYLIGCLCALEFLRRLHKEIEPSQSLVTQIFNRTLKEFLQLQRKYDKETQHRLNFEMQEVWDCFFLDRLCYYRNKLNPETGRLDRIQKKN